MKLRFSLNGREVSVQCPPGRRLIDLLREEFALSGVREGCGQGECGACLVLLNGNPVNACLVPAFRLSDAEVVTVEGLQKMRDFQELQKALSQSHAFPCGFCAPGFQTAIMAYLAGGGIPEEDKVKEALAGNVCRCAEYSPLLEGLMQTLKRVIKRRYGR